MTCPMALSAWSLGTPCPAHQRTRRPPQVMDSPIRKPALLIEGLFALVEGGQGALSIAGKDRPVFLRADHWKAIYKFCGGP